MISQFDPKIKSAIEERLDQFTAKADEIRNFILDNYKPEECDSKMKDQVLYLIRDLGVIAGLMEVAAYRLKKWE